jgi:methylenetetrahydrofolate reductase (NADPH)
MFFDNQKYFDFVKKCRDFGIHAPIIPGIKPLTTKKQLSYIPSYFYVSIPKELTDEIIKAKNDEQVKEIGIEWAIEQSKELIKENVPCIHYYTMGKSEATRAIAEKVF